MQTQYRMNVFSVHTLFTINSGWAETKVSNNYQTRSQELYLASNLKLKEPVCIQSVLRNY